jgi:hypothetical protein
MCKRNVISIFRRAISFLLVFGSTAFFTACQLKGTEKEHSFPSQSMVSVETTSVVRAPAPREMEVVRPQKPHRKENDDTSKVFHR